jgi:hypothetical protein
LTEDFQFVIDKEGAKELGGDDEEEEKKDEEVPAIGLTETADFADDNNIKVTSEQIKLVKGKSGETSSIAVVSKSEQGTIFDVDDDSDDNDDKVVIVDSDDDEEDSADKLSSYYHRRDQSDAATVTARTPSLSSIILLNHDDESSDENEYLGHDGSDSSDDDTDNRFSSRSKTTSPRQSMDALELSFTSNVQPQPAVVGPRGKVRTRVVSVLLSLTRQLRINSRFVHTIECRTKARVPIINCSTRMGFEGDIAIGGHNGVDTSTYAMSQVKRFRSFAPVVLLLKVVMSQQGLDKPFTGGLGSYKLYVLVAYHIERHLANGGTDRPAEILVSLLVRYGLNGTDGYTIGDATTNLEQIKNRNDVLRCDGGLVELTPVFRLSDCVDMFRECYERLEDCCIMNADPGEDNVSSFLGSIVDCFCLRETRETSDRRSRMGDDSIRPPVARNDPGKVNGDRKVGKVFTKHEGELKRGPRGGITPKKRPHLAAKNCLKSNSHEDILQRATKSRKNKKKKTG